VPNDHEQFLQVAVDLGLGMAFCLFSCFNLGHLGLVFARFVVSLVAIIGAVDCLKRHVCGALTETLSFTH